MICGLVWLHLNVVDASNVLENGEGNDMVKFSHIVLNCLKVFYIFYDILYLYFNIKRFEFNKSKWARLKNKAENILM